MIMMLLLFFPFWPAELFKHVEIFVPKIANYKKNNEYYCTFMTWVYLEIYYGKVLNLRTKFAFWVPVFAPPSFFF